MVVYKRWNACVRLRFYFLHDLWIPSFQVIPSLVYEQILCLDDACVATPVFLASDDSKSSPTTNPKTALFINKENMFMISSISN